MTTFFILAGGYGKRALPLSRYLPKPLFPLNGQSLITRMVYSLKELGLRNGIVNLHHLGNKIKDTLKHKNIIFISELSLSGSAVLGKGSEVPGRFLLTVNGDIFLNIPYEKLLKKLSDSKADGVLLVKKNGINYSPLILNGDRFEGVSNVFKNNSSIFTGVALFKKLFLKEFREMSFFETFKRTGADIRVVEYDGIWLDVGTPELYFKSDSSFRQNIGREGLNSVSPGANISRDSHIKDSVLWRNCRIESGARVNSCIVTEGVTVKEGNYLKNIITPDGIYDLDI